MSSCAKNRWGPGTTCERAPTTETAKEIQARLAATMAERAKQDSMWTVDNGVDLHLEPKVRDLPSTHGVKPS
jgi:hypothetical protein